MTTRGQVTQKVATGRIPGSNCDNISLADPSPDMQMRPASECEKAFHSHILTTMRQAFANVFTWAARHQWLPRDTMRTPLTMVNKYSEKRFFDSFLDHTFELWMNPGSPEYQPWRNKYDAAMQQYANAPGDSAFRNFWQAAYQLNGATRIRIYMHVNRASTNIDFLRGGYKVFEVPGAAYAVRGPFARGRTGGGNIEDSQDACLILFGKVTARTKKHEDGMVEISGDTRFSKVSPLTVQQLAIRIDCNEKLLNELLKEIDFKVIASLVNQ